MKRPKRTGTGGAPAMAPLWAGDGYTGSTSGPTPAIGPPCEWPRDPVLQWPERLEDVPRCGCPSVALGRYTDWAGTQRIAVCEIHNKVAGTRATAHRGWATVPWQPEMMRGADGSP